MASAPLAILLTGHKRVGKDSIGDILQASHGFGGRLAFSDRLRALACDMFNSWLGSMVSTSIRNVALDSSSLPDFLLAKSSDETTSDNNIRCPAVAEIDGKTVSVTLKHVEDLMTSLLVKHALVQEGGSAAPIVKQVALDVYEFYMGVVYYTLRTSFTMSDSDKTLVFYINDQPIQLADFVKNRARIDPIALHTFLDDATKESPIHLNVDGTLVPLKFACGAGGAGAGKTLTPRAYLEWLGTDVMRARLGDNVWLDSALSQVVAERCNKGVVITDARFPNELEYGASVLRAKGFAVRTWRVINPHEVPPTGPQHVSATAADAVPVDVTITNYKSHGLEALKVCVREALKE